MGASLPVAHLLRGRQAARGSGGACRGEGLVAGERVPDRFGEAAGEVDLGDLGAALCAEPLFGVLVAVAVERVAAGVHGCFDQRPAQVARPVLGEARRSPIPRARWIDWRIGYSPCAMSEPERLVRTWVVRDEDHSASADVRRRRSPACA
jgi:hypothetical protein